jgi:hypothetical protein
MDDLRNSQPMAMAIVARDHCHQLMEPTMLVSWAFFSKREIGVLDTVQGNFVKRFLALGPACN